LVILALVIWFAAVSWVIGYPGLGANVGGLVTAVVPFGIVLITLVGARTRIWHVLTIAGVSAAAIGVFAFLDLVRPGVGTSHLGRLVSLVRLYGWECCYALTIRKLGMHLGILRLPQAYLPVLFSLPFFAMYGSRAKKDLARSRRGDIMFSSTLPAVAAGVVVAFLFNDSGIVPAALMLGMFVASVLYLQSTERAQ
jgi:hypothetical protein